MSDLRASRRHVLVAGTVALAGVAGCSRGAGDQPDAGGAPTEGATPAAVSGSESATSPSASAPAPSRAGTATAPSGAATSAPRGGPDLTRGPAGRPEVALTFHGAGDLTILRRMLAEFADAKARVTVLGIGTWLASEPQVARLVLDGGHDLGNHTWSHKTMPRLGAADVATEIGRAAALLRQQTGSAGRWFRPSGTPHSTQTIRAAAVAAGYGACLGYDVDPLDYTDPGPDAIVRAFDAAVRPGSIVSLHLGHPGTLAAMPRLLSTLAARNLAAVTTTRLLRSA